MSWLFSRLLVEASLEGSSGDGGARMFAGGGGEDDGRGGGRGDPWWESEPALGRVADGVAHRVGQLRALGNGQVPRVVARAFGILLEE